MGNLKQIELAMEDLWGFKNLSDEYVKDCEQLWSQMKDKEERMRLKRRWLLGFDLDESEQKTFEDYGRKLLPESSLREDDMFSQTVQSAVQAVEEEGDDVFEDEDDTVKLDKKSISDALKSCLRDLTTKGLHRIATTITPGSVKFKKTRSHMKQIIKKSLKNKFDDESGVIRKLSKHLSDHENFKGGFYTIPPHFVLQSHRRAVRKVLDRHQDLSTEALIAMIRKLEGVPEIKNKKRLDLITRLRKTCDDKFLSKPVTGDELKGPLAQAMEVARLSLKLKGICNYTIPEYHLFSQKVKVLQDDIVSAINLVSSTSEIDKAADLEYLKSLLVPDDKGSSDKSLWLAIKKILTEYLFLCGDMDTIPESVSKAVDFINKNSQKKKDEIDEKKDEIDEEVECILNVSAQTKQIVWDMFPHHELDLDFADAYVEERVDDDYDEDGSDRSHSDDLEDSNGIKRGFHGTSTERHEPEPSTGKDTPEQLHVEPDDVHKQTTCNKYLAIQEVCDQTSMIAHGLVGHMLEEFAQMEGLDMDRDDTYDYATREDSAEGRQTSSQENKGGSVLVNVVEELIPSFPKSGIEALRNLVGDNSIQ